MYDKPDFYSIYDAFYCRNLGIDMVVNSKADIQFIGDENDNAKLVLDYSQILSNEVDNCVYVNIQWYLVPLLACLEECLGYEAVYAWAALQENIDIGLLREWVKEWLIPVENFCRDFASVVYLGGISTQENCVFENIVDSYSQSIDVVEDIDDDITEDSFNER